MLVKNDSEKTKRDKLQLHEQGWADETLLNVSVRAEIGFKRGDVLQDVSCDGAGSKDANIK